MYLGLVSFVRGETYLATKADSRGIVTCLTQVAAESGRALTTGPTVVGSRLLMAPERVVVIVSLRADKATSPAIVTFSFKMKRAATKLGIHTTLAAPIGVHPVAFLKRMAALDGARAENSTLVTDPLLGKQREILGGGCVLLAMVAALLVLAAVPSKALTRLIAAKVEQQLGDALELRGEIAETLAWGL